MPIIQYLRREWLLCKSFPESWQQILDQQVPYYELLPDNLKGELRNHLTIFMDEKRFEGCGGLEMTEEKKILISAYAVVLLLGEPAGYYPDLQSILVYPDDYVAPVHEEHEGIVSEGVEARKGESWDMGSIVLSWNDIRENIENPSQHQNLIFHEFAHQMDHHYGLTAGLGDEGEVYRDDEWTRILAGAYRKLRRKASRGERCVLDHYGATDPAELFSVATEAFFLDPHRLYSEFPELFEVMKSFYNLDPSSFIDG